MAIYSIVIYPNGGMFLALTFPVYGFIDYVDPRTAEEPPRKKQRTLEGSDEEAKTLSEAEDGIADRAEIQYEDESEYHYLFLRIKCALSYLTSPRPSLTSSEKLRLIPILESTCSRRKTSTRKHCIFYSTSRSPAIGKSPGKSTSRQGRIFVSSRTITIWKMLSFHGLRTGSIC
jgi:hypothetical protein